MKTQLNRSLERRLMYVENKDGTVDGVRGRIGWVTFSRTGRTIYYYRDLTLARLKGGGVRGNYFDEATGDEYWISGVKARGSNAHWSERADIAVDPDAWEAYQALRTHAP
ncbi:MAG TPA: hypothetical protein VNZ85_18005 [Caulobacter sp.]|nr:hypothetical protein [Caulobacter sp.]